MGLDIAYVAKNDQVCLRLSHVDIEIMEVLAKDNRDDLYLLCNVSDFDEETVASRENLLGACRKIMARLQKESAELFCIYKFKSSQGPGAGRLEAGGQGGIRMNHDQFAYSLDSG